MRLFISIDLPAALQQQISNLRQHVAQPGLKPTTAGQLHITLAFLGEQPDNMRERVEQVLDTLEVPTLTLHCTQVAAFHSGIIYLRVTPDPALMALQKRLCQRLHQAGVQMETRRYTPHITLFRCKGDPDAVLLEQLNALFTAQPLSFALDAIWLKQSRLTQQGAEHTTLAGYR